MDLLKLISPDICLVPLEAIDRREAINALVCHLAEVGLVENPSAITEVVWEREMQRTTGIGEGLAVPHGRCPTIDKLVIAMGIPSEPVDFQSMTANRSSSLFWFFLHRMPSRITSRYWAPSAG